MGNCLWRCLGGDDSESDTSAAYYLWHYPQYCYGRYKDSGNSSSPGPSTVTVVGFEAFSRDLAEFEATNEVPGALSNYVYVSRATQKLWFMRLLIAWEEANPAPTSAEAIAELIIETLQGCSNYQGLLKYYHIRWPTVPNAQLVLVPASNLDREKPKAYGTWLVAPEAAKGVQYTIYTLPVRWNEDKGDGDRFTVFVDVRMDARETILLPKVIQDAALLRHKARAQKNYKMARALQKKIEAA